MEKLVWCAVNISEGRNTGTLQLITKLFLEFEGVSLQHVDIGNAVNRSVFSFFATVEALPKFALEFFQVALSQIDMRNQTGNHPRIGAVDVFPIVPLNTTTMEEAKTLASTIAKQIAAIYQLPIYFYEASQDATHRKRLEQIRKGQYEQLPVKMSLPEWQPDVGPLTFNAKTGATVMGARHPLIAVNFSIPKLSNSQAKQIAKQIRASSNSQYSLEGVKAIGWEIPEYNTVQVSTNITNTHAVTLRQVFDLINDLSQPFQTSIIETELIGLLPQQCLLKEFSTIEEAITYLQLDNDKNKHLSKRIFDRYNVSILE